jgi:hypothetical protein
MFEDRASKSAASAAPPTHPVLPKNSKKFLSWWYLYRHVTVEVRGPLRNADTWRAVMEARAHRLPASRKDRVSCFA